MSGSDCPDRALYIRCPDTGSVAVVISEAAKDLSDTTDLAGDSALIISSSLSPLLSSLSSRSLRYFLMSITLRLSSVAR